MIKSSIAIYDISVMISDMIETLKVSPSHSRSVYKGFDLNIKRLGCCWENAYYAITW